MSNSLYEQDFYSWANERAALLRAGKLSAPDAAECPWTFEEAVNDELPIDHEA